MKMNCLLIANVTANVQKNQWLISIMSILFQSIKANKPLIMLKTGKDWSKIVIQTWRHWCDACFDRRCQFKWQYFPLRISHLVVDCPFVSISFYLSTRLTSFNSCEKIARKNLYVQWFQCDSLRRRHYA